MGLLWHPEIGDEISSKDSGNLSILVDPQGLTPLELRRNFLWLPSIEQMIYQCEARQAVLVHAGLEMNEKALGYKAVVKAQFGEIEAMAFSLRETMGLVLRDVILGMRRGDMH